MNSPIDVIQNIAKSEDRSLVIVFFLFFSRFEYALKRTGYLTDNAEAKACWDTYAHKHSSILSACQEKGFCNAVKLIEKSPPKKQKNVAGHLTWEIDNFQGKFDLNRILTLVCRIRNNLFHGSKFPNEAEEDVSRNHDLIAAGLTVLQTCIDSDPDLRKIFMNDLK